MKYKSSFYNIFETVDEKTVVFNTFTGALCELDENIRGQLTSNEIETLEPDLVEALREEGFIVDLDRDETAEYLGEYEEDKETPGRLLTKLLLATSCNLGCAYCYQGAPDKKRDVISKPDLQRFLNWIDLESASDQIQSVHIELYGGEPLLARIHLPWFFGEISEINQKNNIETTFSITTNGTLLNDDLIGLLISNKVDTQITIDGPQDAHDKRRVWKNGKGSYDQIIENVKKIITGGGCDLVTIRINFDRDNYHELRDLIPTLHDLGVKYVQCGWIQFREGANDYKNRAFDQAELDAKVERELYAILKPYGYVDTISDVSKKSVCAVHRKNDFVFNPQLEAYKCDELMDHPEHRVGRIDENSKLVLEGENYKKQTSRKPTDFESCPTCRYLPICGCGCQIKAMNSKGDMHQNYCEVTDASLKHKIRNLLFQDEFDSTETSSSNCCDSSCGCNG